MPIDSPTDADRLRLATDLRARAALVARDGWADYAETWSTGEVLGVRAVLGEPGAVDAAVEVWAPTLWGLTEAALDAKLGFDLTRKWFAIVARAEPEVLTETEQARYRAAGAATADLHVALDSGDADERTAAFGQLMQTLSAMDPETTRDKLHIPDDAGPHRDALVQILLRIPDGWGRWISCDAGWYPIICELDAALAELDPAYELHQVKEKFGTLRFYYRASDQAHADAMHALVREAETRCAATCELCGQPGTPHTNSRSWMKTLCPSCAATQGYEPIGQLVNDLTADMAGVWGVACYGDIDESIWDLTHGEVTVDGERHRDIEVLVLPAVLRTWRIRLEDGREMESGLVGRIERIR
ncbi:Uncharacterised protein [Mycobacteroides abscessus subsp. abscessus]|uniref:hypothetical protein n=1 Tax=Mycobacteroides abscessus TaxID=36809 RepID=UPI00092AF5F2|nr:hypothetical protein [Mycobacteroides abscessus]SHX68689.1 Uncharacterised protein [Mycobacteroides abscessus subsp. abscessus]SIC57711.1 Uncharacterised protein [Mycobacteroides abscessus subsp. abscessus]SKK19359.1 Uncharacterised protein [Mycobacteroides abscessus subsp. abscessus]SKP48775.1 Uncharacterised protein [Mycobacteroides abscessus subsp. abscessus]